LGLSDTSKSTNGDSLRTIIAEQLRSERVKDAGTPHKLAVLCQRNVTMSICFKRSDEACGS
jgi:hypothetical protein